MWVVSEGGSGYIERWVNGEGCCVAAEALWVATAGS